MHERHKYLPATKLELASIYEFSLGCLRDADAAIAHPLGFTMLPQIQDEAGGYSRVHIWRRNPAIQQVPHSHSGHLRSTILLGRLRNTFWMPFEHSQGDTRIFTIHKGMGDNRRRQFSGTGSFAATSVQEFEPGNVYEVHAGKFHSSECLSDVCVTHVHRQASIGIRSQIVISDSKAEFIQQVRLTLLKTDLSAIIIALEANLERLKAV